jgi:hypothetical protein
VDLCAELSAELACFRTTYRSYLTDTVGWQGRQILLLAQGISASRAVLLGITEDASIYTQVLLREKALAFPEVLAPGGKWRRP